MGFEWFKRATLPPAYMAKPFENLTASGSTLSLYGTSKINRKTSAGASTALYTLPAPTIPGLEKTVICVTATSTRTCRLTVNSAKIISSGSTSSATKITFNKGNGIAYLTALSTAAWAANVQNGTIA